jgi:hypothetical protein
LYLGVKKIQAGIVAIFKEGIDVVDTVVGDETHRKVRQVSGEN